MLDLYLIADAPNLPTSTPVASLPTDPNSPIHEAIRIYRKETDREIDLYKTTRIHPQDLIRLRVIVAAMDLPAHPGTPTDNLLTALDVAINLNQTLIAVGD